MNERLLCCVLSGALAASLFAQLRQRRPAQSYPPASAAITHATECEQPELAQLELAPEQAQLVRRICIDCDLRTASLSAEIDAMQARLGSALASEGTTAEPIRQLARELGQLRAKLVEECVESILSVRSALSPEQLECLEKCCASGCASQAMDE